MKYMINRMGTVEMGRLIRDRRRGLTQEQLEELSGVSQGMISRLERGEIQRPNLDFVRAIARAVEAPYDDFLVALHGSAVGTGLSSEDEEIAAKWRVLELPPDATTDELIALKHLFRALRGYQAEVLGPQSVGDERRGNRGKARGERATAEQPALVPVEAREKESG
jgi:transcriptional regulator with XRE-family HTH domain